METVVSRKFHRLSEIKDGLNGALQRGAKPKVHEALR